MVGVIVESKLNAGVENGWVCVGAFGAPHGVRGDVRLKSFTDSPDAIFTYGALHQGAGGVVVSLKKLRATKDGFVVRVLGVTSPEEATKLKSQKLYVPRDAFATVDEDEYYLADLIGLKVQDADGQPLGVVHAIENFGADDLIEMKLNEPQKGFGRFVFIPFTRALVPEVKIEAGFITVDFQQWKDTQGFKEPEPAQGDSA